MTDEPTCALWFWRYGAMEYLLFATEQEAANRSDDLHMNAEGKVEGIQFADGRVVAFEDWEMPSRPEPQGARRLVRDPFTGEAGIYVVGAPDWLGRQ